MGSLPYNDVNMEEEEENKEDDDNTTTMTTTTGFATTTRTTTTTKQKIVSRIPILGSIQLPVGEGRLQSESTRLQDAGYYSGAILRHSCLPHALQDGLAATKTAPSISALAAAAKNKQGSTAGMNSNNALELLGPFWSSCLHDLKSTKSKSFSFRAKNQMEKSVATQWGNYQKSVMDSGALGDPNESYSVVNEAAGEYKGFA